MVKKNKPKNKMKKETAVDTLYNAVKQLIVNNDDYSISFLADAYESAKSEERAQHGRTWDAAIQAHERRGFVASRSICDFDSYEIS